MHVDSKRCSRKQGIQILVSNSLNFTFAKQGLLNVKLSSNDYIEDMVNCFSGNMLQAIVLQDKEALDILQRCRIDYKSLPLTFEMYKLFDAAWIWASAHEIELPSNSDWDKDFKRFFNRLSQSRSMKHFHASGLNIRLKRKSGSIEASLYEIY